MKKAIPIIFLCIASLSTFAKDKKTIYFYGDKIKEVDLGGGCISIECKPSSNTCYTKVIDCGGPASSTILCELIINDQVIVINKELISHEIETKQYQTQTHKLYLK